MAAITCSQKTSFRPNAIDITAKTLQNRALDIDFTQLLLQGATTSGNQSVTPASNSVITALMQFTRYQGATISSFEIVNPPVHGTVIKKFKGHGFTYYPDRNYKGTDEFRYRLVNGLVLGATFTVSITVLANAFSNSLRFVDDGSAINCTTSLALPNTIPIDPPPSRATEDFKPIFNNNSTYKKVAYTWYSENVDRSEGLIYNIPILPVCPVTTTETSSKNFDFLKLDFYESPVFVDGIFVYWNTHRVIDLVL